MRFDSLKRALKGSKNLMWGINKNKEEFIFSNYWFLKCERDRFPVSIVKVLLPYFTARPMIAGEYIEAFKGFDDEGKEERDLTQIEKMLEGYIRDGHITANRTHLSAGGYEIICSKGRGYHYFDKDLTDLIPIKNYVMHLTERETTPLLITAFVDKVDRKEHSFILGILPFKVDKVNEYLKEEF